MSFREPVLLTALALVPLAVAAYALAQRRGRRYATRYTNLDVLAGVAGRSPTRHIPAALALLALAALAVAVARPERTVAAERPDGVVLLVTDTSSSMRATDVQPSRMSAAKRAGGTFVRSLPEEFRLGLVHFSSTAEQMVAPTIDRAPVLAAIAGLEAQGGTAMGDALATALRSAQARYPDGEGTLRRLPGAIVLLSDGANTHGEERPRAVARRAARARIPIHTVALGRADGLLRRRDGQVVPVPPDNETLREVSRITRGRFYAAADVAKLREIYDELGTGVGRRDEKQELTAAFAGGALALLLLGSMLGVVRSGRLP
jgi:Ca-activated chloride channel homolog